MTMDHSTVNSRLNDISFLPTLFNHRYCSSSTKLCKCLQQKLRAQQHIIVLRHLTGASIQKIRFNNVHISHYYFPDFSQHKYYLKSILNSTCMSQQRNAICTYQQNESQSYCIYSKPSFHITYSIPPLNLPAELQCYISFSVL